ncbi:MAG: hypoxanthine-guanine phosphoribosyltransferase [Burkholderiales bacterium]|nr:hypoxanthine-guanine phosphoribosyltransferase [Burkholderiales bacterium]OUT78514.1 MAG: hypoxanthine-guanine phosphoribosyltransferase [Betaproteobacteria bacterium TMED22]|tara:strand:- start:564 stop:1136 length:573 start_codon:yes stop_codon:yes gene_type:complete
MNKRLGLYESDPRRFARVIITHQEIDNEIKRVANEIEGSIGNQCPIVLSILNGSICFSGQLLTELEFSLRYDVFSMSRYGHGTKGGDLKHLSYPTTSVRDKTVLILDDILDRGATLESARRWAMGNGASQVLMAVLIDKHVQNTPNRIQPDFSCFKIKDEFVFGFGMDIDGMWRNLKDIHALTNPASIKY